MGNLRTKDLSKIGYHNDQLRSLVIGIVSKNFKHHSKQQLLDLLLRIKDDPEAFLDNELTRKIAEKVIGKAEGPSFKTYTLRDEPVCFKTYGGGYRTIGQKANRTCQPAASKRTGCANGRCTYGVWPAYWRCAGY